MFRFLLAPVASLMLASTPTMANSDYCTKIGNLSKTIMKARITALSQEAMLKQADHSKADADTKKLVKGIVNLAYKMDLPSGSPEVVIPAFEHAMLVSCEKATG